MDIPLLTDNSHIPIVAPEDLKSVWEFLNGRKTAEDKGGTVGYASRTIAQQCRSDNADPLALMFRSQVLNALASQRLLVEWQQPNGFRDVVFEVAAAFPISIGVAGFDPEGFVAELKRVSSL